MYKDSILIVYPPGGYGTFMEWCLNYFTGAIAEDFLPFTPQGSSHLFAGNSLDFEDSPMGVTNIFSLTTKEYFSSNIIYPFVRCHGYLDYLQQQPGYTVKKYIDTIIDQVPNVVLLTVPENAKLLILGNFITKTKISISTTENFTQRVITEFRSQFGVADGKNVPRWQLREMISYWNERYLTASVADQYQPVLEPKVVNVSIRELVDNFEQTLTKVFDLLNLDLKRQQSIPRIEKCWLHLQKFINSDQKCQDIINNVLRRTDYHWEPLHLHEEAYVQWQLRDLHGLDLLCYNLDTFPTSVAELCQKLINA